MTSSPQDRAPAPTEGWTLGPRDLPPPEHASPALREILARSAAPDIAAALAACPRTPEEWDAFVTENDARVAAGARDLAARLGVELRPDEVGGVRVHRVTPAEIAPEHAGHRFVHVHGGGFVKNAGLAGTPEAILIAHLVGVQVICVDYRMPPAVTAPAPARDVAAAWRGMLAEAPARSMALGGASAGATLSLAAMQMLKAEGEEMPGACLLGTPVVDLRRVNDSRYLNEGVDRMLVAWSGQSEGAARLYAGGLDRGDPAISPIHGDFSGLPPAYLISGTRDLLLSDTVLAHRALRRAGGEADLHVYEGLSHADYVLTYPSPEVAEHHAELKRFLLKHLA